MKFVVMGVEDVNYTNKQGNEVSGFRLHLLNEDLKRDNLNGQAVEQVFVSARSDAYKNARKCTPNDIVEPVYNRYGSIEDLVLYEG